ncbi:LytA [Bacillus atrophaeus]|uniref:LytA n=1 Tax=Bacillus atrophaeus TaxID=1452 RepID=UPI00227E1B8D|nr:LytA [Bacillus atrophaeus]MCY9198252.1 LytA [Bacillus atrophaeus]
MKKNIASSFLILLFSIILAACGTAEQSKEGNGSSSSQVQNETAYYVGMADTHTIEVKIDDQPVSFEFTDDFSEILNEFEENDKVNISYLTNDKGQKELTEIEKVQ